VANDLANLVSPLAKWLTYYVTDFATASRCQVQPPVLPGAKKSQSRSKVKDHRQGLYKAADTESLNTVTVVRRLFPNFPDQIFWHLWRSKQIWLTDDAVIWREVYPGKVRKEVPQPKSLRFCGHSQTLSMGRLGSEGRSRRTSTPVYTPPSRRRN
jgi:hypothetical protein